MKRILYTFIAAMLVLCGCSAKADKDAFTYENLTLYLDKEENFQEDTAQGYDYCLLGDKVIIFARRISKQELSGMGLTDTDSVFRYGFGDEQEYEEIRGYRTFLYFGSSVQMAKFRIQLVGISGSTWSENRIHLNTRKYSGSPSN